MRASTPAYGSGKSGRLSFSVPPTLKPPVIGDLRFDRYPRTRAPLRAEGCPQGAVLGQGITALILRSSLQVQTAFPLHPSIRQCAHEVRWWIGYFGMFDGTTRPRRWLHDLRCVTQPTELLTGGSHL